MMSDFDNNPPVSSEDSRSPGDHALDEQARRSLLLALFVPFGFVLATVLILLFFVETTLLMWATIPAAAFFIGTFAAMSLILMPSSRQLQSMISGKNHPEQVGQSLARALTSGEIAKRAGASSPRRLKPDSGSAEEKAQGPEPTALTQDEIEDA